MNTCQSFTKKLNVYTVILAITLFGSLVQMDLLGQGLASLFKDPAVMNSQIPDANPAAAKESENESAGFVPERIVIKKANIDLPVIPVALRNGTWQVYAGVANYAESTSLVNRKEGNVGIFGHDREDAFTRIKQPLTGYDIIISNKHYRAYYQITSASLIAPTAVDVFYPTKEPMLTLVTCDGVFSEKRYMVRARFIKIAKI